MGSRALELDLDVDAGREVELHQGIDGLRGRFDDVEQPLMGADLELLARLLVDVRRAVDGELLDPARQRDRPAHLRARPLRRRHDLRGRRIEHAVIERLQADPNVLSVHFFASSRERARSGDRARSFITYPGWWRR